jgi:protein TonB
LWGIVLAVIAVHGLLLYPWRLDWRRGALVVAAPAMQVRVLAVEAKPAQPEPVAVPPPPAKAEPARSSDAIQRTQAPAELKAAPTPAAKAPPKPSAVETSLPVKQAVANEPPAPPAVAPPEPAVKAPPRLPPAPEYQMAGRLDPGPRPLSDVVPVYPPEAGQLRGTVVLRLLINEDGKVDNVGVVRSSPEGIFEASAVEAFSAARFSPGAVLGVPVKSQLTIEVAFTPLQRSDVSSRKY